MFNPETVKACVLRVNLARSAGALVLDGFKLHFQGFGPLTGEDFFTLVEIVLDLSLIHI